MASVSQPIKLSVGGIWGSSIKKLVSKLKGEQKSHMLRFEVLSWR